LFSKAAKHKNHSNYYSVSGRTGQSGKKSSAIGVGGDRCLGGKRSYDNQCPNNAEMDKRFVQFHDFAEFKINFIEGDR
jgi:hypothetical protein